MEQFAKKLAADVQNDYVPHLPRCHRRDDDRAAAPATTFPELVDFMTVHNTAQNVTQQNVFNFANGTNQFARPRKTSAAEYRGSDAFAHAKVNDVDTAFDKAVHRPHRPEKGDP